MSKRSTGKPYLRSEGELKSNINRQYTQMVKLPSKINPIFTERPHYGIPEPKKEAT